MRSHKKRRATARPAWVGGKSGHGRVRSLASHPLRFEPLEPRCLLDVGPLVISELMANNNSTLRDGDGKYPDWIEIHNPTSTPISLQGWYLTDKKTNPTRWPFPNVTLAPQGTTGDYLVVMASGEQRDDYQDPSGYYHTNFTLDPDGEYLALVRPDLSVSQSYLKYPQQFPDVSYGLRDPGGSSYSLVTGGQGVAYHVPTPGEDALAWTATAYDDGAWNKSVVVGGAGLVLTEIGTGNPTSPRLVEIENVADQTIDTTGWRVLLNNASGGINAVNGDSWDLGSLAGHQISAGQVLYKTDDAGDNYWGASIDWSETGSGWAMIVNGAGQVQDFVPWGYTSSQIAAMDISYGGFSHITVGSQWSGNGAAVGTVGGPPVLNWTAFNDHVQGAASNPNDTFYATNGTPSGLLKDVFTGMDTSVTLTTSQINVGTGGLMGTPAPGTDAYNVFNNYVDFSTGNGTALMVSGGAVYTHAFSGLDTTGTMTYDFVGTSIRGGDTYTTRWITVTLVGADSAVPGHTNDSDDVIVLSPTQVALRVGQNHRADQGVVARWTDIDPGPDGEFSIESAQYTGPMPEGGTANGVYGYAISGLRLEEFGPGGPQSWLRRTGNADMNAASDFVRGGTPSKGQQNPDLTAPFGNVIYNTTGVGFSNNKPSFDSLIRTDVEAAMLGSSESLFTRIPFNVVDPAAYTSLTLRMKYDDGFVAYLNGTKVAERNAPSPLLWSSAATASHSDAAAVVFEDIDVSSYLTALHPGTNVLAIHGLNRTSTDDDFLILPELVAGAGTSVRQFMTVPTPGKVNNLGVVELGPMIANVTENPTPPADTQDLPIIAEVTPTFAPINQVQLHYRVNFGSETVASMYDDGTHGDVTSGDHVYTALIPASASTAGQMVRWYVTANDTSNNSTRAPLYLVPDNSPQYFGTVVADSISSGLPVFRWFVQDVNAARDKNEYAAGTRCSIFYLDRFYDNVFVHGRGGYTSSGYRFNFNANEHFVFANGEDPVNRMIINYTSYDNATFSRMTLSFDTFADAGLDSLKTFLMRMQRNGSFEGAGVYMEKYDDEWVTNHGYDSRDALYKHTNYDDAGMGSAGSFERENPRDTTDNSDLQAFLNGIHQAGSTQIQYLYDHVNIAAFVNYRAADVLIHDNDDVQKNYMLFGDTYGTGEWWFEPWDKDLTFGFNFGMTNYAARDPQAHPFFGDSNHPKVDSASAYNYLIDALLDVPEIKQMYVRRLRTVMDELLQPASTPYAERYYENKIDRMYAQLASDPQVLGQLGGPANLQARMNDIKNQYLGDSGPNLWGRRTHFYVHHLVGSGYPDCAGIPAAQVGSPQINFGVYDANPASHNQDEEYIQIVNPNSFAVDISGWTLTGQIEHTFEAGTVILPNGSMYVTPNAAAFRATAYRTSLGPKVYVQGNYKGHLSALGGSVVLSDAAGTAMATLTYPGNPTDAQRYLRVTEINYAPADPTAAEISRYAGLTANDLEFVELLNTGPTTISLAGVHFSRDAQSGAGIEFSFSGSPVTSLGPGQYVVVAKNPAALGARYDTAGLTIVGPYNGLLYDYGGQVRIYDGVNEKINEIHYQPDGPWPGRAGGTGSTLEIINVALNDNDPANWRSSYEYGGSPGRAPIAAITDVVVNEVLTHTDEPLADAIELYNTTDNPIVVGGWYLSDSGSNLKKFRIPDGTTLGAHEYKVYYEGHYVNHVLEYALDEFGGGTDGFALDGAHGDDVWLTKADVDSNLTFFADHVELGAGVNGETFGRWQDDQGDWHLYPMLERTLGGANDVAGNGPRVGPLVISEVMYNPPTPGGDVDPGDLEYVEILNPTGQAVDLTHWRLGKGVDYDFDPGTTLESRQTLVILSFDPWNVANAARWNAFRTVYGIVQQQPQGFVGGYAGHLSSGGEKVQLQRPDGPPLGEPDFYPALLEDEVNYGTAAPWPADANGLGKSLTRQSITAWGDDAASWVAAAPTPGSANVAATIVARQIFYNYSAFDGNSTAANAQDDEAIATGKQVLLPGQTASFANYTSFSRGINGIMIDVMGLGFGLDPSDFNCKVGNDNSPDGWAPAPAMNVIVRQGAGVGGSDRVELIWANGAITNRWLQVTMLDTPFTGLAAPDVFYVGNAVGETGNDSGNAVVDFQDEAAIRSHRTGFTSATAANAYDVNRDGRVNAIDELLARHNSGAPLQLIHPLAGQAQKAATAGRGDTLTATAGRGDTSLATVSRAPAQKAATVGRAHGDVAVARVSLAYAAAAVSHTATAGAHDAALVDAGSVGTAGGAGWLRQWVWLEAFEVRRNDQATERKLGAAPSAVDAALAAYEA